MLHNGRHSGTEIVVVAVLVIIQEALRRQHIGRCSTGHRRDRVGQIGGVDYIRTVVVVVVMIVVVVVVPSSFVRVRIQVIVDVLLHLRLRGEPSPTIGHWTAKGTIALRRQNDEIKSSGQAINYYHLSALLRTW